MLIVIVCGRLSPLWSTNNELGSLAWNKSWSSDDEPHLAVLNSYITWLVSFSIILGIWNILLVAWLMSHDSSALNSIWRYSSCGASLPFRWEMYCYYRMISCLLVNLYDFTSRFIYCGWACNLSPSSWCDVNHQWQLTSTDTSVSTLVKIFKHLIFWCFFWCNRAVHLLASSLILYQHKKAKELNPWSHQLVRQKNWQCQFAQYLEPELKFMFSCEF